MKPCVIYPNGQGGHWLSNLFYGLTTRDYRIRYPESREFNKHPMSRHIDIEHQELATGPIVASFFGHKTQFITYLNSYYKWFLNRYQHQTLSPVEVFFLLTDNARWRMSSDIGIQYSKGTPIRADLMWSDPVQFAADVYTVLEQQSIDYVPNNTFVEQAIANFARTCWTAHTIDLESGIAWLAWCHAICLQQGIQIPVSIQQDFDQACEFLTQKNDWFLSHTQQNYLITI